MGVRKIIKKILFGAIYAVCCAPLLCMLFWGLVCLRPEFMLKTVKITSTPIRIHSTYCSPSNACQDQSYITMGTNDGKLYFRIDQIDSELDRTKYYQYLSVFDNSGADRLKKVEWLCGILDGYAYYLSADGTDARKVYSYELATGNETYLVTVEGNAESRSYMRDGMLYIPTDQSCVSYYAVKEGKLQGIPMVHKTYSLGNAEYYIENYALHCIESEDAAEKIVRDVSVGLNASLIPCEYGLLLHNSLGTSNILYLIRRDTGRVVELLTVPCVGSRSSVAVYKNQVYVSYERYEKPGSFGLIPYENDAMLGTYSISLEDYSIKKLNSKFYNGMYIFDDTGIFVCDKDCNIYKLDFDGEQLLVLFE